MFKEGEYVKLKKDTRLPTFLSTIGAIIDQVVNEEKLNGDLDLESFFENFDIRDSQLYLKAGTSLKYNGVDPVMGDLLYIKEIPIPLFYLVDTEDIKFPIKLSDKYFEKAK